MADEDEIQDMRKREPATVVPTERDDPLVHTDGNVPTDLSQQQGEIAAVEQSLASLPPELRPKVEQAIAAAKGALSMNQAVDPTTMATISQARQTVNEKEGQEMLAVIGGGALAMAGGASAIAAADMPFLSGGVMSGSLMAAIGDIGKSLKKNGVQTDLTSPADYAGNNEERAEAKKPDHGLGNVALDVPQEDRGIA